ncbi:T9SS type A sorting domain-containing protein [Marinoscillum sp. MHG1-6]|uniref:T9SS type A sorting domain-containing protein n=1 Tax=Marinoscillum sp. MHG1-6 TaxID=2959627 RepID=UPI00215758B7|nr:T9SS type A sorting domain-containing protein [Marinoscillum sp. MHG1-6]
MKKIYSILFLTLLCAVAQAQDWTVYEADVHPVDTFDPPFEVSNTSGTYTFETIVDPSDAGNNLFSVKTDLSALNKDNVQFKQFTGSDMATVVLKARTADAAKGMLFDIDFRSTSSARFAIKVLNDGTYKIDKGDNGVVPATGDWGFTATEWTIFRFTKNGADVNVYINEDNTPIYTLPAAGAADGSGYWRFGDGWSSENIDTQFDWIAWDTTGAYSPADQALPASIALKAPLGDWISYEADVHPVDTFDPPFELSNTSGTYTFETIVDPSDAGNNLLSVKTDLSALNKDNVQFKQFTNSDSVTVVLKAKTVDAEKNMLFDIDFRSTSSARFAIKVLNDGTYKIDKGDDGVVPATGDWGFTATEWNIFRFTKYGADVNVYINEDKTPIYTLPAAGAADGSGYWRFGDGWSSENIDTQFDWIVWDTTGAYSPGETRIPDALSDAASAVPTIKTLGLPDALFQDLGYAAGYSVSTYSLTGKDLTADVTITPEGSFEVSLNEIDWFTSINPLIVSQSSGSISATSIYVRLNGDTEGEVSGNIVHTSTDAENDTVAVSGTIVTLIPEISHTGTLTDFTQNLSNPSTGQSYRISGTNLKGDITVTAPSDFEVSADEGTSWSTSVALTPVERTITNALVYVRLNASALGSYSGEVIHSATDADNDTLAVAGEVIPDPGMTITGELTAFSHSLGSPSASQSYTIAGTNLAGKVDISLPEGYEISFNDELWLKSLALVPSEGTLATTTIYIRLNGPAEGSYNGDIVHSSTGVDNVSISVTGTTEAAAALSNNDLDDYEFRIWPNPATDKVIILTKGELKKDQLVIYTLDGSMVNGVPKFISNNQVEIDISALAKGIYVLEIMVDEESLSQKFIKE